MVPYNIESIFREYKNKIYRLALSISRNPKDAEDILQNTILKIIRNLNNFQSNSKLSTWIYRIAYNEALMHLRKRNRQFRLYNINIFKQDKTKALFINWPKLPDKQLLDNELKMRLDNVLKQMPIQYRIPLLLHKVEDLSLKDTAEILGLKLNSLKTRLHRATLIIRREILAYFKDREEIKQPQDKLCNILTGFVYDYAQGNLGRQKESAFKAHIKDCFSCNYFLDTYMQAIRITQALQCQDIPAQLQDKIKSFISNHK